MFRQQVVVGSLLAFALAAPISADAMEPLIPKGEPVGLIVEGDSFRLYYPVPKRRPLEFEAKGPGIVLLYAVNHRRGKRRASSVIEVKRNGKLWKKVRLGCAPSSTTFADTKGRDRPCARTSHELKIGPGKAKISLRLVRSRYGASVAPHFVSERELGLEPALVGLESADAEPALPPPPPPPEPTGELAETAAADPKSTADSKSAVDRKPTVDSPLEPDPKNSAPATDPSVVLDAEPTPEPSLAPDPKLEPSPKAEPDPQPQVEEVSPRLTEKITVSADDDDGGVAWMAPTFSYLGSVAALGTGLYFATRYDSRIKSAEMASVQLERQAFLDEADNHALAANISYGIAGATALLGTYFLLDMYWLSSDEESPGVSTKSSGVGAGCGVGGCEARLWFDF